MNTKLFDKYMSILDHTYSHIDEQTLVSLRSFVNNKVKDVECYQTIMCKAAHHSKLLSTEHNKKGYDWLVRSNFTSKGKMSTSKQAFLGLFEVQVLKDFSHFEFVGLQDLGRGTIRNVQPVYKVIANDRSWFTYVGNQVINIGQPA